MGTRHVVAVSLDGQYKIAQYGQWDGYPDGQGADILTFLSEWDRPLFEKKVRALRFITPEELKAQWIEAGATPDAEWVSTDVARVHDEAHPETSRNTGAGILKIVQDGKEGLLIDDDLEFVSDGLFCEWAYVIDLDRNTFEVYQGFNRTPLGNAERFYFLQNDEKRLARGEYSKDYYPAKLLASFSLSNLPPLYAFLVKCGKEDSEITGMEPQLSDTEPTDKKPD